MRSWNACWDSEGCREARGDPGPPRICSAKLPRCECGLGLDPMARPGGGERPSEAVELLRLCRGDGMWPSRFLLGVSRDSAIARREGCGRAVVGAGCDELECALFAKARTTWP